MRDLLKTYYQISVSLSIFVTAAFIIAGLAILG